MTTRQKRVRAAVILAAPILGLALLSGCSSEGVTTDCGLDQCTLTFDRGVDGRASILGVEAKLVRSEGDQVTLEVAGEQVTLTVGQAAVDVGGFQVSLQRVTDAEAVVLIGRGEG